MTYVLQLDKEKMPRVLSVFNDGEVVEMRTSDLSISWDEAPFLPIEDYTHPDALSMTARIGDLRIHIEVDRIEKEEDPK